MLNLDIPIELKVILLGAIGGFARVIFTGARPYRRVNLPDNAGVIIDFGWMGDLVIGSFAAFIFWSTGWGNPNPPAVYGIALMCGFISSYLLGSYLDRRADKYIMNALTDVLEKKAKKKK